MAIETTTVTSGVDTSTLTTNTNYLQPNGFRISIDRKYFPNFQFFAQSVFHPSMMVNAVEVNYSRIGRIPIPGDAITHADVTFNVMLDENMSSYTEVFNWLHTFVDRNQSSAADTASGPTTADITVSVLSSHNNVVKKIIYRDAFPVSLGDVVFEAAAGDVQYIICPITFSFTDFDIE